MPAADNACTFPCTGNKTQTCGGNKLVSVYMDPTYPPSDSSSIADYTPEGCYTEGYNGRAVAFRQGQLSSKNLTTEDCLGACKSQNFPLAATEFGGECVLLPFRNLHRLTTRLDATAAWCLVTGQHRPLTQIAIPNALVTRPRFAVAVADSICTLQTT